MRCTGVACASFFVLFSSAVAHAQTDSPRFHISVNGGVQAAGSDVTDRREYEVNVETATSESRHPFKTGGLFDGGLGVRLWKGLGAGVAVSSFNATSAVEIDARIPHPFQFNAHREVSGATGGARRTETGVHPQVLYYLPLHGRLRAILFAGPSFVSARQDVVEEVLYDEEFPFDTATFAGADLSRASGSAVGFNVGVDASWMFTARVGAGALVRFTRATLDLDAPANRRVGLDAGGVHIGLGLRVAF